MNLERSALLFEADPARRLPQPDPEKGRAVVGAAQAAAPTVARNARPSVSGSQTIATPSAVMGRPPSSIKDRRRGNGPSRGDFHKLSPEAAHDELDRIVGKRHRIDTQQSRSVRLGPAQTVQHIMGPGGERITAGISTQDLGSKSRQARMAQFFKKALPHGQEAAAQHRGGEGDEPWLEKNRLPHNHPALTHPDEGVRHRAWKIKAQAMANSMGRSYDFDTKKDGRRSRTPATVRILRHKKTGEFSLNATPHGREHSSVPDTHEVWHTTMSEGLERAPLLVELVTSGGVFATGINPGTRMVGSPPRDRRNLSDPVPEGGPTTTANTGHTANTGAYVPDEEKRKIKPPKSNIKIQRDVRDPITKELEAQPAFPGNGKAQAEHLMPQRTQLLGEACSSYNIEAPSWSRNGNSLDKPEDDLGVAMEQWRKECPRYHEASHAAFCSRCDNSWPTFVGGANILRDDLSWVRRFPLEPFPEPIQPREGPKVSPLF